MKKPPGMPEQDEPTFPVPIRPEEVVALATLCKAYMDTLHKLIPPFPQRAEVITHLHLLYRKCLRLQEENSGDDGQPMVTLLITTKELIVLGTAITMYAHLLSMQLAPTSPRATAAETLARVVTFQARLLQHA